MKGGLRNSLKKEIIQAAPQAGFELSEQQLKYLRTVGQVALAITITAGVVAISAVAPNIFGALDEVFGRKQYGSRKSTLEKRAEQLAKSFYYLRRQGFIKLEKHGDLFSIAPTKKALERMRRIKFEILQVTRPKKWNRTWWIVVADIPRAFRGAANMFQKKIKQMQFYPLQRTVWVHPFDPRDEIETVAAHYRVNPFITVMEVKRLDPSDAEILRNFFEKEKLL